jgi:dihydrofolate synthase/folylpolyglutamate synthase
MGEFQYVNAACAIKIVKTLTDYKISENNIIEGLKNAKWRARFQRLENKKFSKKLNEDDEIYLDGSHNVAGAKVLAETIKDNKNNKKVFLILGMLKNKDFEGFLAEVKNVINEVFFINIEGENCFLPEEMKNKSQQFSLESHASENFLSAIDELTKCQDKKFIVISGSLYLAGKVLEFIEKE